MPRAGDAYLDGALPNTHNPLDRVQFTVPKTPIDLVAALEAVLASWTDFVRDYLIDIIKGVTGIDLTSWETFISTLSSGGGIDLTGLVTFVNDLGQSIVDAFNGVGTVATGIIFDVWTTITGLLGIGTDAGSSAATANSRVSTLEARLNAAGVPGGTYVTDPFSGASTSSVPNPPYSTTSSGAGAGTYGLNGSGRMVWKGSGSSDHSVTCLNTVTSLATDNGVVSATFAKKTGGSGAATYLFGRSGLSGVWASVTDTAVSIQTFDIATSTLIVVATETITAADGDVWEFWFGTQADPTLLWVVCNGGTVINPISEGTHTIGSSNRTCGFGGLAKGLPFPGTQSPPAELDSFTYADQGT
jgi:hypothetical protein